MASASVAISNLSTKKSIVTIHGLYGNGIQLYPIEVMMRSLKSVSLTRFKYNPQTDELSRSGKELSNLLHTMKQHNGFDPSCCFITHGYGSLVLREAFRLIDWDLSNSQVFMLAPMNRGCKYYRRLREFPGLSGFGGTALSELCTFSPTSIDKRLGKMPHLSKTVIISGKCSLNPFNLSSTENDGVVSVEETHLPGFYSHKIVWATHQLIGIHPTTINTLLQHIK